MGSINVMTIRIALLALGMKELLCLYWADWISWYFDSCLRKRRHATSSDRYCLIRHWPDFNRSTVYNATDSSPSPSNFKTSPLFLFSSLKKTFHHASRSHSWNPLVPTFLMASSVYSIITDSRTLVMDKTISSTVTPLSSSILRTDEREHEEDIERRLGVIPAPRSSLIPPSSPVMYSKDFFEKGDPEVARARAIYFKSYFTGFGVMVVTIFIVFSIYWGSLWRIPAHSLQGWIIVSLLPVKLSFLFLRTIISQGLWRGWSWRSSCSRTSWLKNVDGALENNTRGTFSKGRERCYQRHKWRSYLGGYHEYVLPCFHLWSYL